MDERRETLATLLEFRIEKAEGRDGFVKIGMTMAKEILEVLRGKEDSGEMGGRA